MVKILVAEGAEYIGSIVYRLLLKVGCAIQTVYSLIFETESILEFMNVSRDNRVNLDMINKLHDFEITYTILEEIMYLNKVKKSGIVLNLDYDKFRNS